MTAQISFLAGEGFTIQDLGGSGLGFYGPAFGASVDVGDYQTRTFITDSTGSVEGPEVDNVIYASTATAILGQSGSPINLTQIPNYQSTLNLRFTYDTPVQVQNVKIMIYDRSDTSKAASGVTTQTAEVIHPDTVQNDNGSGDVTWKVFHSGGDTMSLAQSPGISGIYAGNGALSVRPDTQHDWYMAISASPDSIGAKTAYGLYVSLEYL